MNNVYKALLFLFILNFTLVIISGETYTNVLKQKNYLNASYEFFDEENYNKVPDLTKTLQNEVTMSAKMKLGLVNMFKPIISPDETLYTGFEKVIMQVISFVFALINLMIVILVIALWRGKV